MLENAEGYSEVVKISSSEVSSTADLVAYIVADP